LDYGAIVARHKGVVKRDVEKVEINSAYGSGNIIEKARKGEKGVAKRRGVW